MLGPARNMSFPSRRIKLKNTYNSLYISSCLVWMRRLVYWTRLWLKMPGKWRWTTSSQINQKLLQDQVKRVLKRTFASKLLIPPALQPVSVIFLNTWCIKNSFKKSKVYDVGFQSLKRLKQLRRINKF